MNKELSIKVIRDPEKIPKQSQRALSKRCGVALGSFHYCLSELLKKGYLKVLEQSPLMIISNATKNTLAGYSFGYFVGVPWLQWIAILSGAAIGIFLLLFRQYLWFLAIGLSLITHTSFFPPIPAYMYGSYLILVVAIMKMLNPLRIKLQSSGYLSRNKGQ